MRMRGWYSWIYSNMTAYCYSQILESLTIDLFRKLYVDLVVIKFVFPIKHCIFFIKTIYDNTKAWKIYWQWLFNERILYRHYRHHLNKNSRCYVLFVDMTKCFDTIYRNGLWLNMYKCGIQGKLLAIIRDMYKTCVKSWSSYSDYVKHAVGLRQWKSMSPLLLSLVIEDLKLFLQNDVKSGWNI